MARVPVIKDSDNRAGVIAAVVYLLTVLFLLFFITYSEPDPPKVTVSIPIVMGDDGITDFEVDSGGGGTPSEETEPTITPDESPKEQPTQEEESPVVVPSGSGNSQTNTSTPEPSAPSNPFGGGGSGGSGTSGSGGGFGADTGTGGGTGDSGQGMAGNRVRHNNITSKPNTPNNEHVKIALKLIVDSQGKVLRAEALREGTTTTNQALIDEVIELAKKEVRYAEKPGARNEVAFYTVSVTPR